jgi:hypothetical protein
LSHEKIRIINCYFSFGKSFVFCAENFRGKIVTTYITAKTLQNSAGENPKRRVTVYLPPDYEKSSKRYPVIYFLHGFFWSDSLLVSNDKINHIFDRAIYSKKIKPVIVVMPDESTVFKGSFYANSKSSGNWSDLRLLSWSILLIKITEQ